VDYKWLKKTKLGFDIIAVLEDGTTVVSGVFRVFDSCGLPLDIVFDLCRNNNIMPSWTHFYDDAIKQGWVDKTIFNRLEGNISDVYGKPFWLGVKLRLELYIESKNNIC
jgi:hypothetical protein